MFKLHRLFIYISLFILYTLVNKQSRNKTKEFECNICNDKINKQTIEILNKRYPHISWQIDHDTTAPYNIYNRTYEKYKEQQSMADYTIAAPYYYSFE